ncbi:leukocyte-associated immunoglobulin-like receptor 2 isoform X2 [Mesocricetus auratus]|uniref:Leukocyte-associated immunoglobulin-like receptor 2 isoform X2 n=1 Tax=Mesocricetus auratus TaxID=10036 RepID=A0ABM2WH18_MESAU|nr:leukocyte-associated immunoglobulin-like receptor 2 isoform X2 [Mesocricetus auratus]
MSLCLATVLAVGFLEIPSISVEPGLTVPQGHFVTFVCSSSSGYDIFRLEKENQEVTDKKSTPHSLTEARFRLGPVDDSFAGSYACVYEKESTWSPPSETLELMVTRDYITQAPDPGPAVTSGSYPQDHRGENLIRITVASLVLVTLGVLLFQAYHSQRRK